MTAKNAALPKQCDTHMPDHSLEDTTVMVLAAIADIHGLILNIHQLFVPIVLLAGAATLICGLVLLINGWRGGDYSASLRNIFRKLLTATAGIGALQALWGILLFLTGPHPSEGLHFVYGGIVLLAIPVAYVYSDQKEVRRDIIIMTIAVLAVIGAAIRAVMTGGL
jgi:hypothetical protein